MAAGDDPIVLVMDGACALCSWGARTIARHDVNDVFRIATVQSERGRALLIAHGLDPDDPESWLLVQDGAGYTGAAAVIRVGRRLSAPWNGLAVLGGCVPGFIREPLYRWVARNRIAWFGREDLCALPDDRLRRKLLD